MDVMEWNDKQEHALAVWRLAFSAQGSNRTAFCTNSATIFKWCAAESQMRELWRLKPGGRRQA
eukprot:1155099-Pelagomonas_calceolata.AAC.4